MKKILVTGANGQLGNSLKVSSKSNNSFNFVFTDVDELDIMSKESISNFLSADSFYAIVNCAAYTAVDKAENDAESAFLLNSDAPKYLSQEASKRNIHLIHISTDYVFDGNQNYPFKPDDKTFPNTVYGQSKLDGEKNVIEHCKSGYIIIRTSWLYSEYGHNFVKTMLKLGEERDCLNVVFDQVGTPTYAGDLAFAIIKSLDNISPDTKEILHYSNEGVCSWYDFAKKIMDIESLNCKINPILSEQYPTPASRPKYSVLDKSETKQFLNIEIPHWEDSLKVCLHNLKNKI